jgi:hypothetical protein
MRDLANPKLMYLKAALFLLGGTLASLGLVVEHPEFRTVLLLAVAVWCFARCYYFAFYVIGNYIDPSYRFSGLGSFAIYVLSGRRHGATIRRPSEPEGAAHVPPGRNPPPDP